MGLLRQHGVSDFLELDLMRDFHARQIDKRSCAQRPDEILDALTSGAANGNFAILILRYAKLRNGIIQPCSHRMGFRYSDHEGFTLFDPNAGEFTIRDALRFREWFLRFWQQSGYRKHRPLEQWPFCSVYHLREQLR